MAIAGTVFAAVNGGQHAGAVAGAVAGAEAGETAGRQAAKSETRKPFAMTFHALTVETPQVRVGEPVIVSYVYDKRPECAPIGEGTGRHSFTAEDASDLHVMLPLGRADIEPAGLMQTWKRPVATTQPLLKPGRYTFRILAKFLCNNEPIEQVIPSPRAQFEVIP